MLDFKKKLFYISEKGITLLHYSVRNDPPDHTFDQHMTCRKDLTIMGEL